MPAFLQTKAHREYLYNLLQDDIKSSLEVNRKAYTYARNQENKARLQGDTDLARFFQTCKIAIAKESIALHKKSDSMPENLWTWVDGE